MENSSTDFDTKCKILSDLWMNYKDDDQFKDFIDYNDVGLPLSFLISQDIVTSTEIAAKYINETWNIFLEMLQVEDLGYSSLNELLGRFDLP